MGFGALFPPILFLIHDHYLLEAPVNGRIVFRDDVTLVRLPPLPTIA
jgi:hypothetical protein